VKNPSLEIAMARKKSTAAPETTETDVEETSTPVEPLFDADDDLDEVNADAAAGDEPDAGDDEDSEDDEIERALAAPTFQPTRQLKHFFTREEVDAFQAKRLEGDAEIDELNKQLGEQKEAVAKLKKRVDVLEDEGMKLSRRIRDKCEMRAVSVEERKEFDIREGSETKGQLMMVTYRLDTNEPFDWRELRGNERQEVLPYDAPAKTPLDGSTEVRDTAH
jgi:uncharacterized coiled-coil protein SlyX